MSLAVAARLPRRTDKEATMTDTHSIDVAGALLFYDVREAGPATSRSCS